MDTNERRYLKEIGRSMAAFTVMVAVSIWLLKGHEHSPLRYLVALLPVIPSAFAIRAAIRFFRGLDELQRRTKGFEELERRLSALEKKVSGMARGSSGTGSSTGKKS